MQQSRKLATEVASWSSWWWVTVSSGFSALIYACEFAYQLIWAQLTSAIRFLPNE